MNTFPSWIHRTPEMIEALALADHERIDRQAIGRLFDLRKTATFYLLRRMGAEPIGHSLVISRSLLMARLREAQEHPQWRWERERRIRIRERIDSLRAQPDRKSLVPVDGALRQARQKSPACQQPFNYPRAYCPFVALTCRTSSNNLSCWPKRQT
jgi:hypothetical protein